MVNRLNKSTLTALKGTHSYTNGRGNCLKHQPDYQKQIGVWCLAQEQFKRQLLYLQTNPNPNSSYHLGETGFHVYICLCEDHRLDKRSGLCFQVRELKPMPKGLNLPSFFLSNNQQGVSPLAAKWV